MENILEVCNLYKTFGEKGGVQTQVLGGINLAIKKGEFAVIMGQSGSGKSTLLYNISGMDQASSGTIKFNGEDLSVCNEEKMSKIRLSNMGFIFQKAHLLKNLSIKDNILFPGFKLSRFSREEVIKRADKLMEILEISNIAEHDITKVSGGQLQRAAICRALINEPQILFGDEPTGALNSSTTNEVMEILNKINEAGTAILLVTHDAKVAAWAERVIYLADGNIEAECELGKYKMGSHSIKAREEKVAKWLSERGF